MNKVFVSLTLAAMVAAFAPQVAKADGPMLCARGNEIMNGTYVATGTGTVAAGPITVVSLFVYNGDGSGMRVSGTKVVNGASSSLASVPVSFTVNQDCTGSKTVGSSNFNFIIAPDGGTITWIETDNGVTLSGTAIRLQK